MKWIKKGKLFTPGQQGLPWMKRRAQIPFALIFNDFIRIYFNVRGEREDNGQDISRGAFVDFDKDFTKIIKVEDKPLLDLGELGMFDEFGTMVQSILKKGKKYFMYYQGWTRMVSVPYAWAVGLAYSDDAEHFVKLGNGPIVASSPTVPFPGVFSSIIFHNGEWHAWSHSGIKWIKSNEGKPEIIYRIIHSTSKDGIFWESNGKFIIPPNFENEVQCSATIIKKLEKWHMFFSYRHGLDFRNAERGYRIGYAYSDDLQNWTRDDSQVGIDVSESGWDSEMICYPHVFKMDGKIYMLYCGNDFGEEGFGYAELEMD